MGQSSQWNIPQKDCHHQKVNFITRTWQATAFRCLSIHAEKENEKMLPSKFDSVFFIKDLIAAALSWHGTSAVHNPACYLLRVPVGTVPVMRKAMTKWCGRATQRPTLLGSASTWAFLAGSCTAGRIPFWLNWLSIWQRSVSLELVSKWGGWGSTGAGLTRLKCTDFSRVSDPR